MTSAASNHLSISMQTHKISDSKVQYLNKTIKSMNATGVAFLINSFIHLHLFNR